MHERNVLMSFKVAIGTPKFTAYWKINISHGTSIKELAMMPECSYYIAVLIKQIKK